MTPQALPLEPVEPLPLREAYERTSTINTRYSFEQAMSRPVLALVLRLYAEAIVKQRSKVA